MTYNFSSCVKQLAIILHLQLFVMQKSGLCLTTIDQTGTVMWWRCHYSRLVKLWGFHYS